MSIEGGMKTIADGLVFYIDPADKKSYIGSGSSVKDLSGYKNDITLYGGYSFSTDGGGSIDLDGINGYGDAPDSASLDLGVAWTIVCWVKREGPPDSANSSKIVSKWENYFLAIDDVDLYGCVGTSSAHTCNASGRDTPLPLNEWSYLVFKYSESGGIATLYLNNVLAHTVTAGATGPSNYKLTLGSPHSGIVNQYFNGKMSIVQVYNRELTFAEIRKKYNATKGRFGK